MASHQVIPYYNTLTQGTDRIEEERKRGVLFLVLQMEEKRRKKEGVLSHKGVINSNPNRHHPWIPPLASFYQGLAFATRLATA